MSPVPKQQTNYLQGEICSHKYLSDKSTEQLNIQINMGMLLLGKWLYRQSKCFPVKCYFFCHMTVAIFYWSFSYIESFRGKKLVLLFTLSLLFKVNTNWLSEEMHR